MVSEFSSVSPLNITGFSEKDAVKIAAFPVNHTVQKIGFYKIGFALKSAACYQYHTTNTSANFSPARAKIGIASSVICKNQPAVSPVIPPKFLYAECR